jgi:gluconate 5-dehydrogenase
VIARPGIAPYAAIKGTVKMLTKGMAIDLGKHGIQVNDLWPGLLQDRTEPGAGGRPDLQHLARGPHTAGRWGNAEELGGAAVFLAPDASSFVASSAGTSCMSKVASPRCL